MPTISPRRPLPWQGQVKRERKRFNVAAIGRRAGKTTLGQELCCEPEVLRYPVGWFAPTYKDMLEVWRSFAELLQPITKRISVADFRIENTAGGVLEFWSLDSGKAGRSRKYKRVVIDECAFVSGLMDTWTGAIRPTLADYGGDAYFFSTPFGRNDFWRLWSHEGPDWQSWQMPSMVNPKIPAQEFEDMRRDMPERKYLEEIEAQFISDGAGVIRFVRDAVILDLPSTAQSGSTYVAGVDWALTSDRTVCTVVDATKGYVVAVDAFNSIDYRMQRERIAALCKAWQVNVVIAEANAMGKPNNDQLRYEHGLPVRDFTTTNATKADIIEGLASAFENHRIGIPADKNLIAELESLEASKTASGMTKYAAPAGMHDDYAMSLALAWSGAQQPSPRELIAFA